MPKAPAYRKRSGYDQAIVTLTDAITKRRRDYRLGEHGSGARSGRSGSASTPSRAPSARSGASRRSTSVARCADRDTVIDRGRRALIRARTPLMRLGTRAGIHTRVCPRGFRPTHPAESRAEGADIAIISKQLGRRAVATTARHFEHLAPMDMLDVVRRRHPT